MTQEKIFRRIRKQMKRISEFARNPVMTRAGWGPGTCTLGICGEEAACMPGPHSTHKCVCPNDLSVPVPPKMLCPNRKTVPLTPRPILNINIGGGKISTSENSTTVIQEVENASAEKSQFSTSAFLFGFWGLILLCAGILGTAYWLYKRSFLKNPIKRFRRKADVRVPPPLNPAFGFSGTCVQNPQYILEDFFAVPILSKDNLIFGKEIGQGNFGKVFKGKLKKEDGSTETVAIKVLKNSASNQVEDFLREVNIVNSFRHENILTLIGIVKKGIDFRPWMVFEYMIFGDLANVLRSNSTEFRKPIPGLEPLTEESLLRIAFQIAAGMKYLASRRYVHNDLACRNCLVGSGLIVKISDFGMSRDIYLSEYYRIAHSKPVPIRWMSPESIKFRKFTLESDVWSYGVVLWEIYTYGKLPYYGHTNSNVRNMIAENIQLEIPGNCPPFISRIMSACWRSNPKNRITFAAIYDNLKVILQEIDNKNAVFVSEEKPNTTNRYDSPDTPQTSAETSSLIFATTSKQDFQHSEVPLTLLKSKASGSVKSTSESFPRPPGFPVSPSSSEEEKEMLRLEDYLVPRTDRVRDYINTVPDEACKTE